MVPPTDRDGLPIEVGDEVRAWRWFYGGFEWSEPRRVTSMTVREDGWRIGLDGLRAKYDPDDLRRA